MTNDIMPLSAVVRELRKKGWDISKSKLQYYKTLNILTPVSAFPESKQFSYSVSEIISLLKKVKELQKQGHTLAEIGAKSLAS